MIRLADGGAARAALESVLAGEDLLHGCILSTRLAARGGAADSRFWVCFDEEDEPRAAVLGQPDCFLLCDGGIGETGELADFLRFMDCRCLVGRRKLLLRLHGPLGLSAPEGDSAMVWAGGPCAPDACAVRVAEDFRPIYRMMAENYERFNNYGAGGAYDDWLAGLRLRARDGLCGVYALYEDGEPVATAAIAGASARCVDIGGVVTRRDRRGRGLAGRLVRHLVWTAGRGGRGAVLGCADRTPGLQGYYERLGFRQYDDWAACEAAGAATEFDRGER